MLEYILIEYNFPSNLLVVLVTVLLLKFCAFAPITASVGTEKDP